MMRKFETRFPTARIKKNMQSDIDAGKKAMAVPVVISKALELFLYELCERTYEITATRGAKTLSPSHLKRCVQTFKNFDFLRNIVNEVPDLEDSDARTESNRARGRGRARGRARGNGRGNRATKWLNFEDDLNIDLQTMRPDHEGQSSNTTSNLTSTGKMSTVVRNFDLNLDLDENDSRSYGEMETMDNEDYDAED